MTAFSADGAEVRDHRRTSWYWIDKRFVLDGWMGRVGPHAAAAYAVLCAHANQNGRAWPAVVTVAELMACDDKTARKALHTLVEHGIVQAERKAGRATVYTLLDLPESAPARERTPLPPDGSTHGTGVPTAWVDTPPTAWVDTPPTRWEGNKHKEQEPRTSTGAPSVSEHGAPSALAEQAGLDAAVAEVVAKNPGGSRYVAAWWTPFRRQLADGMYKRWPKPSSKEDVALAFQALGSAVEDEAYLAALLREADAYCRSYEARPVEDRIRFALPLEKWLAKRGWEGR